MTEGLSAAIDRGDRVRTSRSILRTPSSAGANSSRFIISSSLPHRAGPLASRPACSCSCVRFGGLRPPAQTLTRQAASVATRRSMSSSFVHQPHEARTQPVPAARGRPRPLVQHARPSRPGRRAARTRRASPVGGLAMTSSARASASRQRAVISAARSNCQSGSVPSAASKPASVGVGIQPESNRAAPSRRAKDPRARSTAARSRRETRSAACSGVADVQRSDRLGPAQPLLAGHGVEVELADVDGVWRRRTALRRRAPASRLLASAPPRAAPARSSRGRVRERAGASAARPRRGCVECLSGRPPRDLGDAHGCARDVQRAEQAGCSSRS